MKITEKDVDKKANLVDKSLTWFEVIIKKHWWSLILIGLGYLFYWGWTHPEPVQDNSAIESQDTLHFQSDSL